MIKESISPARPDREHIKYEARKRVLERTLGLDACILCQQLNGSECVAINSLREPIATGHLDPTAALEATRARCPRLTGEKRDENLLFVASVARRQRNIKPQR